MSPVEKELASGALLAVAAILDDPNNAAVAEAGISSVEGAIQDGLKNLVKNIPEVKGALGMVEGPLLTLAEGAVESTVAAYIAKASPAELVAEASAYFKSLAAKISAS